MTLILHVKFSSAVDYKHIYKFCIGGFPVNINKGEDVT